ncbi:AAA family ATPase [Streptomyces sp. BI20]|uniref:AAA family ATPase n=1 Tax=Streptomyces sp. BI20 TaxID=3403460 RepID=UPI003C73B516
MGEGRKTLETGEAITVWGFRTATEERHEAEGETARTADPTARAVTDREPVPGVPAQAHARPRPAGPVRDLRGRVPGPLGFREGDLIVVSGLPGGGKSTLMRRAVPAGRVVDSQDTRERWERRIPAGLPYEVYRPLVRLAHYAGLWRALRTGRSLVVHDCGTHSWVRALLARTARRRGRELHLLLLDVDPAQALAGQAARGRGVSAAAFARHRAATGRLLAAARAGRVPPGCASTLLVDRRAADGLGPLEFRP